MNVATKYHIYKDMEYLSMATEAPDYLFMTPQSFRNITRFFKLSKPRQIGLTGRGKYVSKDQLDWWNNGRKGPNPAIVPASSSEYTNNAPIPDELRRVSSDHVSGSNEPDPTIDRICRMVEYALARGQESISAYASAKAAMVASGISEEVADAATVKAQSIRADIPIDEDATEDDVIAVLLQSIAPGDPEMQMHLSAFAKSVLPTVEAYMPQKLLLHQGGK